MKYIKLFENFNKSDLENKLDEYGIKNYTINDDGTIDVNDDVHLGGRGLKKLPFKFGKVTGYFYIAVNSLETLEGSPYYVGGNFECHFNELTNLKGSPQEVGRNFICYGNNLENLDGMSLEIGGDFICTSNKDLKELDSISNIEGYVYCDLDLDITKFRGYCKCVRKEKIENGNQVWLTVWLNESLLESRSNQSFAFDNFEISPNSIEFEDPEDLDLYLQLIEDDGYKYTIEKYVDEYKYRGYIDSVVEHNFIIRITISRSSDDESLLDLIEDVQKVYKLFSDKYSDEWDSKAESFYNGVRIKMVSKKIIPSNDIFNSLQSDVEKSMNNLIKNNIVSSYRRKFLGANTYNIHYLDLKVKDLVKFKENWKDFVNENKYTLSVEYTGRGDNNSLVFSLMVPILNLSI